MSIDSEQAPNAAGPPIIGQSLQAGVVCGTAGFIFGGASGILKGTSPFLFATAAGIQTFVLGTAYWGTRSSLLNAWGTRPDQPSELIKASALAGGLSGGVVALVTRGRRNVLPAAVMWSLLGGFGQFAAARLTAPRHQPQENFWTRMARKEWSPVTVLTDAEYAKLLQERMLKIETEIALVDDRIAALKQQQAEQETPLASSSNSSSTPTSSNDRP